MLTLDSWKKQNPAGFIFMGISMRYFVLFFLAINFSLFGHSHSNLVHNLLEAQILSSSPEEWEKQKRFFRENGYLWIRHFFSPEQIALLEIWAEQINHEAQTTLLLAQKSGRSLQEIAQNIPGSLIIVPEARDPLQVCRTEDMLTCYPDLLKFIEGTLTFYIGQLMDEPYVLFKDKLNFKWPGGGAFLPHQDFPAYEFFGPREHVTAMVCIDPATLENGCLQVAEHWRETFADHPDIDAEKLKEGRAVFPFVTGGKEHGSIQPQYCAKMKWLPLIASKGDVILISSYIPHYSEPNLSQFPRRAMFFTHNRLLEGEHRKAYYYVKRQDPDNPMFHIGTPTKARGK